MERNRNVEHLMTQMKITREEALALIEFDKTSPKLDKPVKAPTKAPEKRPAARPATNSKDNFISAVAELVNGHADMLEPQQLKSNSITFKDAAGNYYTLALTAHKGCPQGYRA